MRTGMVNSVLKAIQILEKLSPGDSMGVSDLARTLKLPKSTVFAVLETLQSEKLVEKNIQTGKYRLGIKLIELGYCAQAGLDLCRIAAPLLKGLNIRFDETVHLTVLEDDEVLYIDCIESQKRLRTYSVIGIRAPLFCTAVGKAILAFQPEEEIDRIVAEKGLPRFTANTITTKDKLHTELAKIRTDGFSIDNMEHEDYLRCVGVPIRNAHDEVFASISVSGPAERNTMEKIMEMVPYVIQAANEISIRLGYRKEFHHLNTKDLDV
jgi:DNA-binding IclR family transcriptional regulator